MVQNVAREKGLNETELNREVVFQIEQNGDEVASYHIQAFIEKLAVQLFNLQYVYDSEMVLIGGGVSKALRLY